ncbi:hypothetical protein NE865_16358 [Phthorimaea operculella]|nr:hypothetical protein NE865_16358 [Phthorimaea operculella]
MKWSGSRGSEHERYWRRTPSRTPSRTPRPANPSRVTTPASTDMNFDNGPMNNNSGSFSGPPYPMKIDKTAQTYLQNPPLPDFDPQYVYYPDQQEDSEIKYSRSPEYGAIENGNNVFAYNMPALGQGMKLPPAMLPAPPRKTHDFVKIIPKQNNILVKNMSGVQYLTPGLKPMHAVVMPSPPTFVQKNVQNNMIVAGNMSTSQMLDNKSANPTLPANQFNPMSSATFTPGTTVVTQNSQIIYREMVQSLDGTGKPFISSVPAVLSGHDNVTNIAQTSSMYQNVMVVDQFGNASCMYTGPQQLMPKGCNSSMYNSIPVSSHSNTHMDNKAVPNMTNEFNKTLVIEVGPIVPPVSTSAPTTSQASAPLQPESSRANKHKKQEESEPRNDTPGSTKGLKILSNIKVEVPVQHNKNMLNKIMDLTGPNDTEYQERSLSPERILPDLEVNNTSISNESTQPSCSSSDSLVSHTFSVIKNVGNPPSYKESTKSVEKIENEFSDSCPVPDLICNEKPSISPCSELSENGDHLADRPVTPKTEPAEPTPSSSTSRAPEDFSINKLHQETKEKSTLHTVSIEKLTEDHHEFDADTEEQSMDLELVPPSSSFSTTVDIVQVKEEINTSNEGAFSNEASSSDRHLTPLETLRPINVITYSNMPPGEFDEESNHRELLDLEAASKNKQFVNMMNENYFGDYADYFTPDRVESFEDRPPPHQSGKDGMYIWGEPSTQKENEFVLPNFIHESYKIAESNYTGMDDAEGCERDSKADVLSESRSEGEPPLNICTDEKMPPRGELSGQESNGDMESAWNGMYPDVPPSEPYDLMARESWVSDGSDVDANEKRETLEDELQFPKSRLHTCSQCGAKCTSLKELRAHKSLAHAIPTSSKTSYSRMVTARTIKKEEKTEDVLSGMAAGTLLSLDNKECVQASMLSVYEAMAEAKPQLDTIIKQETKRRRKDYVCPVCKEDQGSEAGLYAHRELHPLECLTCGKCFRRRANLALHIKTHYGIKNYKCEVCEKRFITRQKLAEHHNTHTGRAPIKCTHCDHTFRRYSNMVQHRDRHHFHKKTKVRDFVCHCGAIFHSRAKLLWHKETHDDKPKCCLYCSDKFVHAASLTRHVRRKHNEYYVPPRRPPRGDRAPQARERHLPRLQPGIPAVEPAHPPADAQRQAPLPVHHLQQGLHHQVEPQAASLDAHEPLRQTIQVLLCKGAFIRQTEYISHMNAHKSVRPYTCNYCGCQFIRKYNCQRHVREHEMAKKYVCKVPECGKSFHRSYYLSEHMKVHSGARPFSCSICGKTSSNKSNHNKHLKIHHAREPIATEA